MKMNNCAWMLMLLVGQMASASHAPSVAGEFIVKLKSTKSAKLSSENLGRILGGVVKSRFAGDEKLLVLKKPLVLRSESVVSELTANPAVEYVEPNYILKADRVPDDTDYSKLWGMSNVTKLGADVNAEKAWDITVGSRDVVVAVIDTGVDYTHDDLKDNAWRNEAEANGQAGVDDDGNGFVDDVYGYNFNDDLSDPKDDHGHGTHVSGTIGGTGNNTTGVVGVNWQVKIMAIKFLGADGSGSNEGAINSIDYASQMGARVINASWGGGGNSVPLREAIERAAAKNVLFVAAAGNDSTDTDSRPHYPSSYDIENVLSVASIEKKGILSSFSNFGKKTVDIAAPGSSIYSTVPGNKYKIFSGTSMATPHVAGVAALVLSHKDYSAVDLKKRLMDTAKSLPILSGKCVSGGLVDAYSALTK